MKLKKCNKIDKRFALAVIIFTVLRCIVFIPPVLASSNTPGTSLSEPWEIVIKMGFEGDGLILPLRISDQNKPEKLNITLSVPETALKVRLEEYIPDLIWETTAVRYSGDGIAAKLKIKGKDLEQEVWLGSANPAKQAITSSIGGVAIKKLNNNSTVENLVKELTNPKAIGVLSVWPKDSNVPFEYAVKINDEIIVPRSEYKLTILDYMPHYSIDVSSDKVVNLSEEPINPAIKIAVDDGKQMTEQWIWSKFLSSPHQEDTFPLRMQFIDFDSGKAERKYFLVVASDTTPWLLSFDKSKKRVEKVIIGHPYLFTNEEYFFEVEEIIERAIVETNWKNNSEKLINPALVVTIEQDGTGRQAVLELSKPFHYKTDIGTLVLLYRQLINDNN